jgi:hypothetical protein
MAGQRLSRREFLSPRRDPGYVEPTGDVLLAERPGSIIGTVVDVHGSSSLTIRLEGREHAIQVVAGPRALIDRDGPATLVDLTPGDEVFAQGHWSGASLVAGSVALMHDAWEEP